MPTYSVACSRCGARGVIYRKVEDRNSVGECECGNPLARVIDLPVVRPEIAEYHSPNDGRLISSRAQQREDLRRSNAIEWEPGIREEIARRHEDQKKKAFEPISQAVDNIVRDLNTCGKLENINA